MGKAKLQRHTALGVWALEWENQDSGLCQTAYQLHDQGQVTQFFCSQASLYIKGELIEVTDRFSKYSLNAMCQTLF